VKFKRHGFMIAASWKGTFLVVKSVTPLYAPSFNTVTLYLVRF